jgi:holliday junction DNA helicase RuvA
MISSLTGKLIHKTIQKITLEVIGIGFDVNIPFSTFQILPQIDQEISLLIHTHFSDGAIALYGFYSLGEKEAFEKLIGISKIGPKIALAILSGIPLNDLKTAIIERDSHKLSSISGVGKKTAERIILELSDKKDFLSDLKDLMPILDKNLEPIIKDASAALEKLGFTEREVNSTIRKIIDQNKGSNSVQYIIKESLKLLKKN